MQDEGVVAGVGMQNTGSFQCLPSVTALRRGEVAIVGVYNYRQVPPGSHTMWSYIGM